MQSKFAADIARPGRTLMEALEDISAHALEELAIADRERRLVDVRNPNVPR